MTDLEMVKLRADLQAEHMAGRHDDPNAQDQCDHCRTLIAWFGLEHARKYTAKALRSLVGQSPMALAHDFLVAKQEQTAAILKLLRQEADHPAAPPGRNLYLNEVADLIARTFEVRG